MRRWIVLYVDGKRRVVLAQTSALARIVGAKMGAVVEVSAS
jgi:hypothetical protein